MPHRTIAIGDIHGCSEPLRVLIEDINPGPEDVVVTLGDYINRGPDTRGVLELLVGLARRCRLVPILGNHDEMLLEAHSGRHPTTWLGMGGIATLNSYGKSKRISLIPEEHIAFLRRCLDYHETPTHIFVHANYHPNLPMDEQPLSMLRWESLKETTPGPHGSSKSVIAGHSSQKSGEILDLGYLKCIDTFCHGGGWLTALDADTAQVWQVNRDGKRRQR